MKVVLGLSVLIVSISAFRRQFNCTVDHQNDGAEMDWDGARVSGRGKYFSWNGKVPYFFDNSVIHEDKALIRKQMKVIEEQTCVRFNEVEQYDAPRHRLKIMNHNFRSCQYGFSAGVRSGGNNMEIVFESYYQLTDQSRCKNDPMYLGGILHELMHALGAIHTHERRDRDEHIDYWEMCVKPGMTDQFQKVNFNFPSDGLPMSTTLSCIIDVTL